MGGTTNVIVHPKVPLKHVSRHLDPTIATFLGATVYVHAAAVHRWYSRGIEAIDVTAGRIENTLV